MDVGFSRVELAFGWGLISRRGGEIVMPPFLALNLRKKNFFYYSMEAYIVHLAKGIRIFGQGYALKP
jgi:hypothetical protein